MPTLPQKPNAISDLFDGSAVEKESGVAATRKRPNPERGSRSCRRADITFHAQLGLKLTKKQVRSVQQLNILDRHARPELVQLGSRARQRQPWGLAGCSEAFTPPSSSLSLAMGGSDSSSSARTSTSTSCTGIP